MSKPQIKPGLHFFPSLAARPGLCCFSRTRLASLETGRVGGEVGLRGTRPMTDSLPPLIEPNGRISHIRLSGLIHRAAFHFAVVGSS